MYHSEFSTTNIRNPLWLTQAENKLAERVSSSLLVGRNVGRTATGSWQKNKKKKKIKPPTRKSRAQRPLYLQAEVGEDAALVLTVTPTPQHYH